MRNAVAVAGLCAGLGVTGCFTTRSDRQTISSIVKAIIPRPGGLEIVKCAVTRVYENKQECVTPILFLGKGGGGDYTNDYLEESGCWSTFIWTGDAS